ncbi:hypothetical protein IFM89_031858 [Coptis chinensis]|uniref:Cytochrome P450 n=1 Tax=Coptis chinensis TaxID=261450 RepID=A0A835H3V7_9MAGN|nr:hypothetical protein IFM89_031858 [Coptis chinensis]
MPVNNKAKVCNKDLKERRKKKQTFSTKQQWAKKIARVEPGAKVVENQPLCESLRLYPPIPATHRGVEKEDVLPNGTTVKPGMMILISMYAMGRLEWEWGKYCLEYKLERWIDENGKLNPIPLTKFFTFLAGPRNCIGRDMAFTQMNW